MLVKDERGNERVTAKNQQTTTPIGVLSKQEYDQRVAAGASPQDLVKESKLKYYAGQAVQRPAYSDLTAAATRQEQSRVRNQLPGEGTVGAGVTPPNASPVGNRDSILQSIKDSARNNPYTGYGDRFQAVNNLAATYRGGEPVNGWQLAKGFVSSGLGALTAGARYGMAKAQRKVDDWLYQLPSLGVGSHAFQSTVTDDQLYRMAEEKAREDAAFRSYIFGRKPD